MIVKKISLCNKENSTFRNTKKIALKYKIAN